MTNFKFKKRVKSIIALCLAIILSISTFVIVGAAIDASTNASITWDFAGQRVVNDAGNELRYATIEEYVEAGKLTELEGLYSSSADGSQFCFHGNNGLMVRVTGNFIARVADNSPITATVRFRADSNDMRPIVQASSSPNGPWVTVTMTYDAAYEKGSDGKYPAGTYTISTEGIGEGNCFVKYSIPSESAFNTWYWDYHCLETFTFDKNDEPYVPEEDNDTPNEGPELSEDAVLWQLTDFNGAGKNLGDITGKLEGMVGSYCDANGQWRCDSSGLQAVISGTMVIQMAENSPFVATFTDDGSGLRPTVKVGASVDGPWTTVTPTYTKDESTGRLVLTIDNIGEGNYFVNYTISGTGWGNYWYHKLRTVTFNKWVAPSIPDGNIKWDFSPYTSWKQNVNLANIIDMDNYPGIVSSGVNSNSETWVVDSGALQVVGTGRLIIKMAKNSPFTATFADNGSGYRPTIQVGKTASGPWTTVTPTYTTGENNSLILTVDGIGEGNCYLQYVISGTTWTTHGNHKLRTATFKEWVDTGDDEADDSHLPKCDTKVVFNRAKNATYWDFRECFKVSSNMFFAGIEGGFFPNTMPYEGGQPFVTMRVGKNSPIVVCYSQKADKVPKFYVSGDGADWKEIQPDLTDVNSKGQKRAIFNGIGESNMFFQFEFPQDNNDMVSARGWIVTLESISYNLAGGVADPDATGKVKYNFTKYSGNGKNLANITGELTGMVNSFCDANGQWRCDSSGLQAVLSGTMIFATKKNSPLEIVYTKTSDDVKFSVKVGASAGGPWKELKVQPVADGNKYTLSVDGIGEENAFVELSITNTTWDNFFNFKLRTVTFTAMADSGDEVLGEGMTKVNFVSSKWNQNFDLTKYPQIIGLNGVFVSDKPGYMRMDIDWNTFTINTDNKSSIDFVMDNNSSVVLNITAHGNNLEDRPTFYVSSDKKKWTEIKPNKVENLGADIKIGSGDYIIRYTFDGIGKKNIFFRFEFGVKKGEKYTLIGLRDVTFKKNTTYVLPDEPILDSVIIFDAQKNSTYYDFRACDEVTDNMFYGGNERGVFPCTTTTTGHQPGVIIKVAANSPIAVRYKDIGLGKKPIYGVSKDKKSWTIIESDWTDKDSAGDTVDVFNTVGEGNYYFRFEFPQTQKEFAASQGWLLTLQSICFNEYKEDDVPETKPTDTPDTEEKDGLDEFLESLKSSKPVTTEEKPNYIIPIIIVAVAVVVLAASSVTAVLLINKKRKNK